MGRPLFKDRTKNRLNFTKKTKEFISFSIKLEPKCTVHPYRKSLNGVHISKTLFSKKTKMVRYFLKDPFTLKSFPLKSK